MDGTAAVLFGYNWHIIPDQTLKDLLVFSPVLVHLRTIYIALDRCTHYNNNNNIITIIIVIMLLLLLLFSEFLGEM